MLPGFGSLLKLHPDWLVLGFWTLLVSKRLGARGQNFIYNVKKLYAYYLSINLSSSSQIYLCFWEMLGLQTLKLSFSCTSDKKICDLQTCLWFIAFVSVSHFWNMSLCNMNKFVLIFQCIKDDSKYRNGFFLKPPFLFDSTHWFESKHLRKILGFVAQIYIFPCSLSSLSQLWRNYYHCSIWFFMDFTELVSSLRIHSGDWSTAQKCTKDISGELPLALRGVTHIHMILIKRWIPTSISLNVVLGPVLRSCDLLLFLCSHAC